MTTRTTFHNYQHDGGGTLQGAYDFWDSLGWSKASPGLTAIRGWALETYGGTSLGLYGRRPIRGSTSVPSTHGAGAAWDWRYAPSGSPKPAFLDEVFDVLIDYSQELGIQAIHDYYACRIWRSNRSGDENGGWKLQTPSSANGMGQSWANYLHIEIHPDEWADGADVVVKLGVNELPPFNPDAGHWSLYPIAQKRTLRYGASGDDVRYLQGVMKLKLGQSWLRIDGQFGRITRDSVKAVQRAAGIVPDGIVGSRETWPVIDAAAMR